MTINDEFFKKTQENLRRIKSQNNQKTMKSYAISGKAEAEELPSTQPQKTQREDNVIVVDFKKKKSLNTQEDSASEEERLARIGERIKTINALMDELRERNKTK